MKLKPMSFLLAILLAVPCWAAAQLEDEYKATIEKLLPGMAAKEIPARQQPQQALEKLCHQAGAPGQDEKRAALSKAIMGFVGPETAKPARVWLLRKIEPLGREEVVAGLTGLMKDQDPEIRDLARRALANNPTRQAARALRAELAKADDAAWKVALINALGWRKDTPSAEAFGKLAADQDAAVARAAAAALGDIATEPAVAALASLLKSAPAEVRPTVIDASLRAAKTLCVAGKADEAAKIYEGLLAPSEPENIRVAALAGLGASGAAGAVPKLLEYVNGNDAHLQMIAAQGLSAADKKHTADIVAAMEKAGPAAKPLIIEALGDRGDKAALEAVTKQAADGDADVRLAAIQAIGKIGDASSIQVLMRQGARGSDAEREAARNALATLRGEGIDEAIVDRLSKARAKARIELIYAVWGRRIPAAKPAMLEMAANEDPEVRVAAFTALERLAGDADLPKLVELLTKVEGPEPRKAAETAIASVCRRAADKDACIASLVGGMAKAEPAGQVAIIKMLAQLQGNAGLAAVRAASKSDQPTVKQAATAALAQWQPVTITTWLYAGLYRQDGKGATELFDIAFPPESGDAQWKPLKARKADGGAISLPRQENCCGYVKATIQSERKQDVVLVLGSDDGIKVWLNGKVVHANNATRGIKCDEDQVKVTLNEGQNTLMLKITQGASDWAFCCGIKAADGGPPDGLRFEAR